MSVMEMINKVVKTVDPAMRVPFIFAIDWFLNTTDYSNLYSFCWSLPVFVVLLPMLFLATNGNLLFIGLDIIIVVTLSTIREYLIQNLVFAADTKKFFLDGLIFYQGLAFIVGLDSWLLGTLKKPYFLMVLVTITGILSKLNYGFLIAFLCFMVNEFFGLHTKLKQSFHDALFLAKNLGYLNTFIYYYRSKRITLVLKLFWLSAVIMRYLFEAHAKFNINWFLIITGAVSTTNLRLFALALWLPEISYAILWTARALLSWSLSHTANDLEPRDMGKALVFFFIGTFNSVLDADIIERAIFIGLMLFISFSYILQNVFKLCDETLKTLSTSLQYNYLAHIRAVTLTLMLIWVLLHTSWLFCSMFTFRVWQLVVVSSNVVTAMQSLSSLAVYALFVYDLKSLNKLEQLDDWVYYLNAFSNSLEFLSAFLLLGFGVWDVIQGSWNILGLVVIVVHTYYNVWLAARNGWKIFLNRRTAVNKLNSLADATEDQLKDLHDLCAICFDSMASAKITQCGHYFHSNCLRKWLYIQSSCPLCHHDVMVSSRKED